jgi:hypothetical protein
VLSPGAVAGISVGSIAVALFLAGAFVFVYTLGRRRRLAENPSASQGPAQKNTVPIYTNTEASGFPMVEMPAEQVRRLEMPTGQTRLQELPGYRD